MQNYKLSVTKNWKKYTLIFKSENEQLARERVHNEWYSILSIEEVNNKQNLGHIFIFLAKNSSWDIKNWKIVSDDIFKAYVKLRKNLEYNVINIYSEKDKNISEKEKLKIIKDLEEEYNIYISENSKKQEKNIFEKNKEKIIDSQNNDFYLKKELEEVYKVIDLVLIKLEKILSWEELLNIDDNQKEKLKNIFNSIIKFKKTTNISKLREIWELALMKIWKFELYEIEVKKKKNYEELLKETNFLLKKVWSKQNFVKKSKDIKYIINTILVKITYLFSKKENNNNNNNNNVDKHSYSYIKNILFLKKYKQKLIENNIYILKNLLKIFLKKDLREEIFLKRKVIKQNIILFKAKQKWLSFSYTSIKKWLKKIVETILKTLKIFNFYLFIVIFIYIIIFILVLNINYYNYLIIINYNWLFYFIIIYFVYLILYFTRNLFLIIFNFVLLLFLIIFLVVNF